MSMLRSRLLQKQHYCRAAVFALRNRRSLFRQHTRVAAWRRRAHAVRLASAQKVGKRAAGRASVAAVAEAFTSVVRLRRRQRATQPLRQLPAGHAGFTADATVDGRY